MTSRFTPWSIVLLVLLFWMIALQFGRQSVEISYTEFKNYVSEGRVASVIIEQNEINGTFKQTVPIRVGERTVDSDHFTVVLPPSQLTDPELMALLERNGVEIEARAPSIWPQLLISFLPILLLLGVFWYFLSRSQAGAGQVMQFGQSRARAYGAEHKVSTTFADVAGQEGPKRELMEVVDFLKSPKRYQALGAEIPKGVLLVGPPGTGKTLLARAVAGEAGVPFFSISASEFMEMFVGVGASRVRTLFQDARKNAPSIIFIDELDSIGRKRGAGIGGGHDEREQTLNQILSEMDGFEKDTSVIVISATNRPDILDPALLRPGRFDRQVVVGLPSLEERVAILKVHMRGKPIDPTVNTEELAHMTPGFSGADIKNLVNEAALMAGRENAKTITSAHFQIALDKIVLGLEREALTLSSEERRAIAYHEAGHAVVSEVLPYADRTQKVSIVPRGMALGVTWHKPEERVLVSENHLMDELSVMMAGRAAESLFTGILTTGAADDFKRATEIAKRMVLEWGMGEHFKHMAFGSDSGPVFLGEDIARRKEFSEETARLVDLDIRAILNQAYQRTQKVLQEHHSAMEALAAELLEHETIPGDRVREILAAVPEVPVERFQKPGN